MLQDFSKPLRVHPCPTLSYACPALSLPLLMNITTTWSSNRITRRRTGLHWFRGNNRCCGCFCLFLARMVHAASTARMWKIGHSRKNLRNYFAQPNRCKKISAFVSSFAGKSTIWNAISQQTTCTTKSTTTSLLFLPKNKSIFFLRPPMFKKCWSFFLLWSRVTPQQKTNEKGVSHE